MTLSIAQFITKRIEELQAKKDDLDAQKKKIDVQIEGLKLARNLMRENHAPAPAARRRTLDRQAQQKTLTFMAERKSRPTTVNQVVRKFRISQGAAHQRLAMLTKAGKITRVKKGAYMLVNVQRPKQEASTKGS